MCLRPFEMTVRSDVDGFIKVSKGVIRSLPSVAYLEELATRNLEAQYMRKLIRFLTPFEVSELTRLRMTLKLPSLNLMY